jgi:hypothetical protein
MSSDLTLAQVRNYFNTLILFKKWGRRLFSPPLTNRSLFRLYMRALAVHRDFHVFAATARYR